jgi:hypothetical protein
MKFEMFITMVASEPRRLSASKVFDWPCVPCKGELIEAVDGWCSDTVGDVSYSCDGEISVELETQHALDSEIGELEQALRDAGWTIINSPNDEHP